MHTEQKSKLLGGGWRSNIGGCIPHPPGICSPVRERITRVLSGPLTAPWGAGLQIRVQHWGDNQHILVNFLILGGMIPRLFVWE